MVLNWNTTKAEALAIRRIVLRYAKAVKEYRGIDIDCMKMDMDLTACHANGCPLDLHKLEHAPEGDFLHDANGIACHIDRETGQLLHCFLPRCAMPESAVSHD